MMATISSSQMNVYFKLIFFGVSPGTDYVVFKGRKIIVVAVVAHTHNLERDFGSKYVKNFRETQRIFVFR